MTIEEAIEYWEQFNAEIDDLYDACSDAEMDVLVKQREIIEYTISALRKQEQQPNAPLTLDELVEIGVRAENGENIIVYCTPLNDWAKVFKFGLLFFGTEDYRSWPEIEDDYGKTWLAYRQKQKED